MVIDTQVLRSAALRNSGRGLPFPDGAITPSDRTLLLGQYPLAHPTDVLSTAIVSFPNYTKSLDFREYNQRLDAPNYTKSLNAR